jgi:protein SCO1/2
MGLPRLHPASVLAAIVAASSIGAREASAQLVLDALKDREGVGIVDRKGEMLPLDLTLTNSDGATVRLGDYFDGKTPVLLVPAYLDCPLLCTMVFERVQQALNGMRWTAGQEFRVVTFSIDHRDTPTKAKIKQESLLLGYDREVKNPSDAWAFLVGDAESVRTLSSALGYHYRYLPESGEYSHNAAIYFVRPDGTVHNFIEGLEYPSDQLTLALSEAAEGKVGTVFERFVFSCYMYDPKTGQYVIQPMTVMRIGGGVTLTAVGAVLASLWLSGRLRARVRKSPTRRSGNGSSRVGGSSRDGQPYTAAGPAV